MLEEKNLASIMLDGRVQEVSPADVAFVAYYPTEDIILYSGGHSSDFSLSLRTGETLETVGNPEYFIESPNKKRRLNGSFGGQECSSYFFQEKINKYYTYLREFSWGNHRFNTFCYFKKFYWLNDEVFIFSHIDSYDENSKELYKYFKGSFVE